MNWVWMSRMRQPRYEVMVMTPSWWHLQWQYQIQFTPSWCCVANLNDETKWALLSPTSWSNPRPLCLYISVPIYILVSIYVHLGVLHVVYINPYSTHSLSSQKGNYRPNHIMAHSTAKLGGPASDIVIAKVGVSYPIAFAESSPYHTDDSYFVRSMGLWGWPGHRHLSRMKRHLRQ